MHESVDAPGHGLSNCIPWRHAVEDANANRHSQPMRCPSPGCTRALGHSTIQSDSPGLKHEASAAPGQSLDSPAC
eukprot:12640459-Alexandrium_andersonii.AAC.1